MTFAAEMLKLRAMPTPRVIVLVCVGFTALAALILALANPTDVTTYEEATIGVATIAMLIGGLVFGCWIFGVEFAQGTLRRVLISEPRRERLLLAKALGLIVAVIGFAIVLMIIAVLLTLLVASINSVDVDNSKLFEMALSGAVQMLFVALVSGAIALLFQSFTGGLIATFALVFVIDGVLSLWKTIEPYTFGLALSDIDSAIVGNGGPAAEHGLITALAIALAWVIVIGCAAAVRFARSDFK